MPGVRPTTYRMQAALDAHDDEADRERRRSLRTYGLHSGERAFDVAVTSEALGLRGKIDLVITTTDEVIPIEYKDSDGKVGRHFLLQLAAYGLLLEEATHRPCRRGFLYFIPQRRSHSVLLDEALKTEARHAIHAIQTMIDREAMPDPTPHRERCPNCEFRRFCNDVL
jgi:CRISPR-associated exonuclease Cas4